MSNDVAVLAPPAPPPADPAKGRKAELLAARAEREQKAIEDSDAHELLVLELEDRFCREYGARGQGWEICNEDNSCGEGPICIRLGDPVAHKAWIAAESKPEDKQTYVAPYIVYPDKQKALDILYRRPELLTRAVMAMNKLFGFSASVAQGKY